MAPSQDVVTYESVDNVATITIQRPEKLNAINSVVSDGLLRAFTRLESSEDRVGIITGAGTRAFSSGADVKDTPELRKCMPQVGIDLSKPLIAAVAGHCVGGAMVLVQMCDLCVVDETALFTYPEARLGLTGGLIASIAARIPHKIAMEILLTGAPLTAQRAYEVGFVNKVVPKGQHLDAAMEYARTMAASAPLVLAALKEMVAELTPRGSTEIAGRAMRRVERIRASQDIVEGRAAAKEKRIPRFTGA